MTFTTDLNLPWDHNIIAFKGGVVLLQRHTPHDRYVTYRYDAEGNCYWGRYHPTLEKAEKDFDKRALLCGGPR